MRPLNILKGLLETLKVTPMITNEKTKTYRVDICPHCQKEIGEKEISGENDDKGGYSRAEMIKSADEIDKKLAELKNGNF